MTTEERIAQIAQGFGQGVQNYQQQQGMQRAQQLQDEARKRQEAIQALEVANSLGAQSGRMIDPSQLQPMLAAGDLTGIGQILQSAPVSDRFKADQAKMAQAQEIERLKADKLRAEIAGLDTSKAEKPKDFEKLTIPGLGVAKTEKEAQDIRASLADANDAIKIIDQIKDMGKNVSIFDRERVSKINSLKNVLAGKLRLPLTGPGAMTEDEFQRLLDTMGDPTKLASTEKIELAKLDQLKGILDQSVKSKFQASAMSGQQMPTQYTQQVADQSRITDRNNPALMNAVNRGAMGLVNDVASPSMANDAQVILSPERTQFRQSRLQELRQKAGMR